MHKVFWFAILTKTLAFKKQTVSHVIESSHRNYSGFQKAEFLENSKVHIFISLHYKIPAQNEKLAQVHVSSFCPSYSKPLIETITHYKCPPATVYRWWSKYLNCYVHIDHECYWGTWTSTRPSTSQENYLDDSNWYFLHYIFRVHIQVLVLNNMY